MASEEPPAGVPPSAAIAHPKILPLPAPATSTFSCRLFSVNYFCRSTTTIFAGGRQVGSSINPRYCTYSVCGVLRRTR
ncbi:MAG: hypothetical protein ACLQBA_12015, partial [Candidatus Binataceae bacterium]